MARFLINVDFDHLKHRCMKRNKNLLTQIKLCCFHYITNVHWNDSSVWILTKFWKYSTYLTNTELFKTYFQRLLVHTTIGRGFRTMTLFIDLCLYLYYHMQVYWNTWTKLMIGAAKMDAMSKTRWLGWYSMRTWFLEAQMQEKEQKSPHPRTKTICIPQFQRFLSKMLKLVVGCSVYSCRNLQERIWLLQKIRTHSHRVVKHFGSFPQILITIENCFAF